MGSVGARWHSAVDERFFGSFKHDWAFKIVEPTRGCMKADVMKYVRQYNMERLHSTNQDMSPVMYEKENFKLHKLSR